jgi:hypothetical protein
VTNDQVASGFHRSAAGLLVVLMAGADLRLA